MHHVALQHWPLVSFAHWMLTGCVTMAIVVLLLVGLTALEPRHPSRWLQAANIGLISAAFLGVGVSWLLGQGVESGVFLALVGGIGGFLFGLARIRN